MIKKALSFIVIFLALVSCEKYCPHCGEYYTNRHMCSNYGVKYSSNDHFCAETLLGTWQMDYNRVNGIELKQIEFFDGHRCRVIMNIS